MPKSKRRTHRYTPMHKRISIREKLANVGYRRYEVDPEFRQLMTLYRANGKSRAQIERESGVTSQTQKRWEDGKTKRPQNLTMSFVGKALGYERKWVKKEGR